MSRKTAHGADAPRASSPPEGRPRKVYRWCRRCTVVGFAVAVFGTTAFAIMLARIYTDSDSVRGLLARFVNDQFANAVLGAKDAKLRRNTVTIENVSITQKDQAGVDRSVVAGGNLELQTDLRGLASGHYAVKRAQFSGGELNFHFDKNGRCAAFRFKKASDEKTIKDPIALDIVACAIHVTFESPSAVPIDFTNVSGRIDYDPNTIVGVDLRALANSCPVTLQGAIDMKNKAAEVTSLVVDAAPLGKLLESLPPSCKGSLPIGFFALGKANLSGAAKVAWRDEQPKVEGRIAAVMIPGTGHTPVKSARLAGSFDAATGLVQVMEAALEGADLAAALPLVPNQHRGKIAAPETLRGALRVAAQGTIRTKEKPLGWEGKVAAELKDASWAPAQSPFPITHAAATVELTPAGLSVQKAEATIGPCKATASGMLPDWDASRARLAFTASNVLLCPELRDRLPPREHELWDKFKPEGSVSVSGEAAMNNGKPRFVGQVTLHDNAITYEKFPIRTTGAQGSVEFRPDGRVEFDAVGKVGSGMVRLTGTMSDLSPISAMELTLTGEDVAIDDDLRRAFEMHPSAADSIRHIHALGKGKGVVVLRRRQGSHSIRAESAVDLDLRDFRADWFPYPLDRVTGKVVVTPDRIEFQNCVGVTSAGARLSLVGWSQHDGPPSDVGDPTGRNYLQLDFLAEDAPLDRTLRDALPAEGKAAWDQLRPQGRITLTARFVLPPGRPARTAVRLDASRAAITPIAFPYRLHTIEGDVQLRLGDGHSELVWKDLVARHGDVEWYTPKGFARAGEVHFDQLAAPRLPLDADLKAAVPSGVASVLEFLSPSTPAERVELSDLNVKWSADKGPAFQIGEAKARFVDADVAPAIGAKRVTGEVTLSGSCVGGDPDFDGNLYLSSVVIAGFKTTALQSRLQVRGPRIEFNGLKADFYGGELHGLLRAVTDPVPEYEARLTVIGASLKDYARQAFNSEAPLKGDVSADLHLHNKGRSVGRLAGYGNVEIREVDVLRLPILVDQLNFLLTQLPQGKTFDRLWSEFLLDGSQMRVTNLRMSSPAGAFALQRRDGHVNLDTGALDFDLVYELFRGFRMPIVTGTLTGFHVGGTFGNPEIRPQPQSGIKALFQKR